MGRSLFRVAIAASAFVLLTSPVAAQNATATASTDAPGAITTLSCYSRPGSLTSVGSWTYQSSGYCQGQCVALGSPVMATTGGSTCYCGDELPALDEQVDSSNCNMKCAGYDLSTCGGIGYWQLYLTGLTGDVQTAPNSTTSSGSTSTQSGSSTSSAPAVVTKPGETVVVTQAPVANDTNKSSGGGPNKVAIAVGVVVGVIALAAIVGGILLYLRHKRNREIEEEHRRNAAVTSFVGSATSDKSSNDQRLDPSIYSHSRQSIGSIADERDFTRRILLVRNPDRESKQSTMA